MEEQWKSSIDIEREKLLREKEERRKHLKMIIHREDYRFERSSQRGLWIAPVIRNHVGFDNRVLALDILHLPPGKHCEAQRNPEALMHILNGRGYSLINGEKFEWERGDTLHIKQGYWHQHYNLDDAEPANMLWASIEPLINYAQPMFREEKGDDFSDTPEDYIPPHPFGYESQPVEQVGNEKWLSKVHLKRRERIAQFRKDMEEGRTIMRAREIRMERSEHKGDFIVGIADPVHGFFNNVVRMHLQQLPPESHTDTHRHDEAIIYVLKGQGYTLMDGVRHDWREGDCIFIPTGVWHQHWNVQSDETTQHIAITFIPLREKIGLDAVFEQRHDGDFSAPEGSYVPRFPWDLKDA